MIVSLSNFNHQYSVHNIMIANLANNPCRYNIAVNNNNKNTNLTPFVSCLSDIFVFFYLLHPPAIALYARAMFPLKTNSGTPDAAE